MIQGAFPWGEFHSVYNSIGATQLWEPAMNCGSGAAGACSSVDTTASGADDGAPGAEDVVTTTGAVSAKEDLLGSTTSDDVPSIPSGAERLPPPVPSAVPLSRAAASACCRNFELSTERFSELNVPVCSEVAPYHFPPPSTTSFSPPSSTPRSLLPTWPRLFSGVCRPDRNRKSFTPRSCLVRAAVRSLRRPSSRSSGVGVLVRS